MEQIAIAPKQDAPAKTDDRILFGLAVLALALTPTQLTLTLKGVELTAAELVLAVAFLVWVARWLVARDTRSLPPITHWLIVGAAALGIFSLLSATPVLHGLSAWKSALVEQKPVFVKIAQLVLYLLVASTVFRSVLTTSQRIRTAVIALLATTTLAVLLGVVQWAQLARQYQPDPKKRIVFADSAARDPLQEEDQAASETPSTQKASKVKKQVGYWDEHGFHPCSRLKSFLIVQTPNAVSSTFGSWSKHGYYPSRNAYAGFLALVLPFALALLVTERKRGAIVLWLSLLFIGAACSLMAGYVAPALLLGLLVTGVSLGMKTGRYVVLGIVGYVVLISLLGGLTLNAGQIISEPLKLKISTADAKNYTDDGVPILKKSWGEQQAALNVYRHHPLFGVGSGRYQEEIANGYDTLGGVDRQRLESDAQNGYLLTLVSTGLLGLAALLALLGGYLKLARDRIRLLPGDPWAAAQLGALVAVVLMLFATNVWVRGTSVVFAALLAMISNYATLPPAERMNQQEEV